MKNGTFVMGIDPGPRMSHAVLWDGERVLARASMENPALKLWLAEQYLDSAARRPMMVGLERMACYGMPVGAETFEAEFWGGRFSEFLGSLTGAEVLGVKRLDVKRYLTGDSRAKDKNVRWALIEKCGAPGTKKAPGPTYGIANDLWSALAIAVYTLDVVICGMPDGRKKK